MAGKINQTFNPLRGKKDDAVSVQQLNDVLSKINLMKQTIERSLSNDALQTLITRTIAGSGGGGSSSGSTVENVTKAVVAGTTYNEVFTVPSLLLSLPIVYVTDDSGLMSATFPPLTLLTVNSFTIIPIESGTLIYSYINL